MERMLIDASQPEEVRLARLDQHGELIDYDYESNELQAIKGNIYLAKISKVEASLQAAFVDYGTDRHGFLAFSEIHPDYFNIPVADREKINAEVAEQAVFDSDDAVDDGLQSGERAEGGEGEFDADGDESNLDDTSSDQESARRESDEAMRHRELLRRQHGRIKRQYKIQEVIRRNQVILVQIIKDERASKGAALTTYLSLAGRYCVLMPNSPRIGGVSRKISNVQDRKRLKQILAHLALPAGMGLILRTAGEQRSKVEIRRDFEFIIRLWNEVRQRTLDSIAPQLINEDGTIIKRAIRDIYHRDISEIIVAGKEAYREARDFMKMMIPSHVKRIKLHNDKQDTPIFQHYPIEAMLDALTQSAVRLPSGGELVIEQTEALVSIDINSGKSTRERHIEETALKTNLEAASEIARQLRLRDLAGLIVIDFIDMEENRNNIQVEQHLKECFRGDRARIGIGRISNFGLLEMSRQRLRTSLIEATTSPCPYCGGTGAIRSQDKARKALLRELEWRAATNGKGTELGVRITQQLARDLLNRSRETLMRIEQNYEITISFELDDTLLIEQFLFSQPAQSKTARPEDRKAGLDDSRKPSSSERSRSRRRGGRNRKAAQSSDHEHERADNEHEKKRDASGQQATTSLDATAEEVEGNKPAKASRRRSRTSRNAGATSRSETARHGEDAQNTNTNSQTVNEASISQLEVGEHHDQPGLSDHPVHEPAQPSSAQDGDGKTASPARRRWRRRPRKGGTGGATGEQS
ncbi:MAG: ribonuclease E/G [Pseudomonadota bacterium]